MSQIAVTVDGYTHAVDVPAEWSGTLIISVNCHRGHASRKILVARQGVVMLGEKSPLEGSHGETES